MSTCGGDGKQQCVCRKTYSHAQQTGDACVCGHPKFAHNQADNASGPLPCSMCDKEFESKDALREHGNKSHRKRQRPALTPESASNWSADHLEALHVNIATSTDFKKDILQGATIDVSDRVQRAVKALSGVSLPNLTALQRLPSPLPADPTAAKFTKALFCMRKYKTTEAAVSNLMFHLLDIVGANDGDLIAFPKMPCKFSMCGTKKDAIADWCVIDLNTYFRLAVVEEKDVEDLDNANKENDETAHEGQVVAQAIAAYERNSRLSNKRQKVTTGDGKTSRSAETKADDANMYMVRVLGGLFSFYRLPMNSDVLEAVNSGRAPDGFELLGFRYAGTQKGSVGLDPLDPDQRAELLTCLDALLQMVRPIAASAERRDSGSSDRPQRVA